MKDLSLKQKIVGVGAAFLMVTTVAACKVIPSVWYTTPAVHSPTAAVYSPTATLEQNACPTYAPPTPTTQQPTPIPQVIQPAYTTLEVLGTDNTQGLLFTVCNKPNLRDYDIGLYNPWNSGFNHLQELGDFFNNEGSLDIELLNSNGQPICESERSITGGNGQLSYAGIVCNAKDYAGTTINACFRPVQSNGAGLEELCLPYQVGICREPAGGQESCPECTDPIRR